MPVCGEMPVCYGGMFEGGYSAEGYGKWTYGGLFESLNCIMNFGETDGLWLSVSLIGGRTMRAAKLSLPVYPGKTGRLGGSF